MNAPPSAIERRRFLKLLGRSALGLTLAGCGPSIPAERYTEADREAIADQRAHERQASGTGPYGPLRFRGYRGLADLRWFEVDEAGVLRCSERYLEEGIPRAIDFHAHLGMSVLFEPELDLQAKTERVFHLLDCDGTDPGCELDLDVYINANFSDAALEKLERVTLTQGLWGSEIVRSQTIPNLVAEMDAMRVERSVILPIVLGLPFGDNLTGKWRAAIAEAKAEERLIAGISVHPRDPGAFDDLERLAREGGRIVKLHPPIQRFFPDAPEAMKVYEAAQALDLTIFFHGGRAGIGPSSTDPFALPRHYQAAFENFPRLRFVLGHAGARDGAEMLELGHRYANVWFGTHGQSVTHLEKMIQKTGGQRLVFGTDWPFYHIAASLAKILIVTDRPERTSIRDALLRTNALELLS